MKALLLLCACALPACSFHAAGAGWEYDRLGAATDLTTKTRFGILFEGGGSDVDDAYSWMCPLAGNGDFLILRASGTAAYNTYIARVCPAIHAVSTLILSSRAAADDPFVTTAISQAEAIFISGGDQANYVNFWKGTAVERLINARAAAGVPVGGTSAGNAILAEWSFSALKDTITSPQALADPYDQLVTLTRDFLRLSPLLNATIMDDHFVTRDRMGRLLTFMARTSARAIALDDGTAFLMDADGRGRVTGAGAVYFLRASGNPELCRPRLPLTFRNISVRRLRAGNTFDLRSWTAHGGVSYSISAVNGKLQSTQPGGAVY